MQTSSPFCTTIFTPVIQIVGIESIFLHPIFVVATINTVHLVNQIRKPPIPMTCLRTPMILSLRGRIRTHPRFGARKMNGPRGRIVLRLSARKMFALVDALGSTPEMLLAAFLCCAIYLESICLVQFRLAITAEYCGVRFYASFYLQTRSRARGKMNDEALTPRHRPETKDNPIPVNIPPKDWYGLFPHMECSIARYCPDKSQQDNRSGMSRD